MRLDNAYHSLVHITFATTEFLKQTRPRHVSSYNWLSPSPSGALRDKGGINSLSCAADCMTRSSTKELLSPFENPKQKFRSRRRLFDTPSLLELNSPEFDHNFDIEEQSEEEVRETMTETMEQYMSKTRGDYGSGVIRPSINHDTHFELKGQFLKELRDITFSGLEHKDANEHIEKVLEIVDLFHIPKITQDQIMLRAFPVSLTGVASRWLRNQPSGSITTWEVFKTKFLNKYCPPARTAKKIKEINNFQQEPDESLFHARERFKELLMKCPQHYLTDMQEKWHNGTSSRTRSTETSDELAAIQAQLNNLGREIKKVNEKVYAAQFDAPYQPRGQYRAARPRLYQQNNGNSSYPNRRTNLEESLTKFIAESAKRYEENSNIIKEIRAFTDAAIRNQGASIKTLEIHCKKEGLEACPALQRQILETKSNQSQLLNLVFLGYAVSDVVHTLEPQDVKILDAYDHTLPQKEKDLESFTLPSFIHNIYFDKALVDLGASDKDEGKSHAGTLIDIPVFVKRFSIILGFTIIEDDDMTKDVVLGMKFCKKYASCQMIMKKFALGDKCEQIMEDK
ncbi:retrovirus-related pol polyprotein from transposon TNT 1-94 [Tanacetum coccineum]